MSPSASRRIAVIMAGGAGERFWPISRPHRPKQLLPLGPGGRTLLADTVRRMHGLVDDDCMLVVTGRELREPIISSDMPVFADQVIAEPARRNTMGAIAWATAWVLGHMGVAAEDAIMAVIPADHYVGDMDAFRDDVEVAMAAAEELGALVTVGIPPTRPEVGYGYIEVAPESIHLRGRADGDGRVHAVARFREKPDFETAAEFLRRGHFLWNSGMFFWRISSFLEELAQAGAEIAATIRRMAAALAEDGLAAAERLFETLPDISVDYALMERAQQVAVVRAGFPWDDLGAWDAWRRVEAGDAVGNVTHGDPLLIDCRGCAVYDEMGEDGPPIAVIGLDGVVVAVGRDGVLVAPLSRAQEVRDVAARVQRQSNDAEGQVEG